MILTVLRPAYFMPISDCARSQLADVIVFAETHQFSKQETIHRTAIKTITGKVWLSVPVLHSELIGQSIAAAHIDARQPWQKKHLRALELNYRNSPYYYWHADGVIGTLSAAGERLSDLLWSCSRLLFSALDVHARLIGSSALDHQIADRTDRALAWLKACACDTYLLPPEELGLLDQNRLRQSDIRIIAPVSHPVNYHQQYGAFVPGLSSLDLLFNEGPDAPAILKKQLDPI
jgi:hypothetical protein